MKNSYWGYWLIVLGVFIVAVLLLVDNYTTTNSQDYYLIKEITEAAMIDSVDYAYYSTYGEIKINKEKFYEVFIRRFSEDASLTTTYDIGFYDVYEAPPKVGVQVTSKSSTFNIEGNTDTFDIVNKVDAILELKHNDIEYTTDEYEKSYVDLDEFRQRFLSFDDNVTNELKGKTCTATFSPIGQCKTSGTKELEVLYCGVYKDEYLSEDERKFVGSKPLICVAYEKGNELCQVVTDYDNFVKHCK